MILSLFFTRGVSLEQWSKQGLLDREKLIYEEHLLQGNLQKVYWFTYGSNDKLLSQELKNKNILHQNIEIFEMPKIFNIPKIGSYIYSIVLPLIYKDKLKNSDILKTNQTDGCWSALMAKKLYGKKLLYRTGFTMSKLENKLKRFNIIIRKIIEIIEKTTYRHCDMAIVTSRHDLDYILNRYKIDKRKARVVYNFIDRDKFYDFKKERENKVLFVGRLSKEKNIFNLIKALSAANLPIEIYGSGPLQESIQTFITKNGYKATLMSNIPNKLLPEVLNNAKYFTLVSEHEGMPKALLEGMACGCICIGTNVAGINEIIDDKSGILSESTSYEDIKKAFLRAKNLTQEEIEDMKQYAKKLIDNNFSLKSAVEKEARILQELRDE